MHSSSWKQRQHPQVPCLGSQLPCAASITSGSCCWFHRNSGFSFCCLHKCLDWAMGPDSGCHLLQSFRGCMLDDPLWASLAFPWCQRAVMELFLSPRLDPDSKVALNSLFPISQWRWEPGDSPLPACTSYSAFCCQILSSSCLSQGCCPTSDLNFHTPVT